MRILLIVGMMLFGIGCGITGIEEREDNAVFEGMTFTVDGEVAPVVHRGFRMAQRCYAL